MGLDQQLADFKSEFMRTAPAGRATRTRPKSRSFGPASPSKRRLALGVLPLISGSQT
jgi:hypothetical protein